MTESRPPLIQTGSPDQNAKIQERRVAVLTASQTSNSIPSHIPTQLQRSRQSSNPFFPVSSISGQLDTNTQSQNPLQNSPTNVMTHLQSNYLSIIPTPLQTSTQSTGQSYEPTLIPTEQHTNTPLMSQSTLQNNATLATLTPSVTYMPRQSHTFTRRRSHTETVLRGLFRPHKQDTNFISAYTDLLLSGWDKLQVSSVLQRMADFGFIMSWFEKGGSDVHVRHIWRIKHTVNEYIPSAGFKLMRCTRSQNLIDIPIPNSGYSIPYLKGQHGLNKATAYIVPLQNFAICNCRNINRRYGKFYGLSEKSIIPYWVKNNHYCQ